MIKTKEPRQYQSTVISPQDWGDLSWVTDGGEFQEDFAILVKPDHVWYVTGENSEAEWNLH